MSLIQSARLNGHDPYAYLKDVLTRLPTQRASEIEQGMMPGQSWALLSIPMLRKNEKLNCIYRDNVTVKPMIL